MNDRELLELAAKACGYEAHAKFERWNFHVRRTPNEKYFVWLPLDSKADCLQMEIELGLDVEFDRKNRLWTVFRHEYKTFMGESTDRQRASTMAAAQLGRAIR